MMKPDPEDWTFQGPDVRERVKDTRSAVRSSVRAGPFSSRRSERQEHVGAGV